MCYQANCVDGSKILKNKTLVNPCVPNPCQNGGVCYQNLITGLLFCNCKSNILYAGNIFLKLQLNNS